MMTTTVTTKSAAFETAASSGRPGIKTLLAGSMMALVGVTVGGLFAAILHATPIPAVSFAAAWTGTAAFLFVGFGLSASSTRPALLHSAFGLILFWLAVALHQGALLHPAAVFALQGAWAAAHLTNEAEADRHPLLLIWSAINLTLALQVAVGG